MTDRDYQAGECAWAAGADGTPAPRRRRILAGEGMVKPVEPVALDGEVLDPRTARLAVTHPAVRRHPERFRCCDPKDRDTRAELRSMLIAAGADVGRQVAGRRSTPRAGRLSSRARPKSWRL